MQKSQPTGISLLGSALHVVLDFVRLEHLHVEVLVSDQGRFMVGILLAIQALVVRLLVEIQVENVAILHFGGQAS